ncbi:MAG: hypothetical protein ACJ79J_06785 [Gemmatimonadaceae bacterium]
MTDRNSTSQLRWRTVAVMACFALAACGRDAKRSADSASAEARDYVPSDAKHFSAADFATLRWIEGDWRGRIPSGAAFYERYKFVDDSTIMMHGFEDSTLTVPNDSATIVFRNGVVIDRGGKARWTASRLDSTGIDFAPAQGATNQFSWNRQSADKWTAAIRPRTGNRTVYPMERIRLR